MPDNIEVNEIFKSELFLICSPGGRILSVSPMLRNTAEIDTAVKNINDIFEDKIVSSIIKNSEENSIFEFECELGGREYSCGSKISPSNNIVIVFGHSASKGNREEAKLIRYMGREINADIDNINIAMGALKKAYEKADTDALGLIEKSVYNLARMSKNAVTKVDYEEGSLFMDFQPGNIAADIEDVCRRASEFAGRFVNISCSCTKDSIESVYDSTAVRRMVLNMISYSLRQKMPGKSPIYIKSEKKDENVVVTVSFNSAPAEEKLPGGFLKSGDIEYDIAVIIARKHKGSIISVEPRKGYRVLRMTLPVSEPDKDNGLSSMMIDWYGGMDIVEVELSGVMPPEAYGRH